MLIFLLSNMKSFNIKGRGCKERMVTGWKKEDLQVENILSEDLLKVKNIIRLKHDNQYSL